MVTELSRRTSFSGPALVRLLSRLAQVQVTEPRQSPAARLDEWLGWTESIVLSKVLGAAASAGPTVGGAVEKRSAAIDRSAGTKAKEAGAESLDSDSAIVNVAELAHAEYTQVRDTLEQAIVAAMAPPAPVPALQRRQMRGAPKAWADVDFPSYRRRYSLLQQKMESSVAALRGRLRALLAAETPEMAQLAAVDAAMEQALAEHELRQLAGVPNLLERRFFGLARAGREAAPKAAEPMPSEAKPEATALDEAAPPAQALAQSKPVESTSAKKTHDSGAEVAAGVVAEKAKARTRFGGQPTAQLEPGPWLDEFRDDMRAVLLAELDLRLQPVDGLMAALDACKDGR